VSTLRRKRIAHRLADALGGALHRLARWRSGVSWGQDEPAAGTSPHPQSSSTVATGHSSSKDLVHESIHRSPLFRRPASELGMQTVIHTRDQLPHQPLIDSIRPFFDSSGETRVGMVAGVVDTVPLLSG
jgi:hypothetical protein